MAYDLEQENLSYWFFVTGELLNKEDAKLRARTKYMTPKEELQKINRDCELIKQMADEVRRGV